jgi:SPX domain protein involved in polyphosphate accumulation
MSNDTPTVRRFNRYELKYVLPVSRCAAIMKDLEGFVVPDPHGGREGYRLVSLYYDSPGLDFFWAKVDGLKFRRKLRLRIYPAREIEQTARGMVEIKQRINRTVQKRRVELPLEVAEALCSGSAGLRDLGPLDDLDQEVASEVLYLVSAMHLRPSAVTAYRRIAYVGSHYESGVRITFDMDLRGRTHALRVHTDVDNPLLLSPEWCVLEVKTDETVPDWVTSLLARHRCQMQRVSKYCAAVAKLSGRHIPVLARDRVALEPRHYKQSAVRERSISPVPVPALDEAALNFTHSREFSR